MAQITVLLSQELQKPAQKLRLFEGKSVLDSLLRHGIPLEHECGGTLACATCRVIVREGLEYLSPASEDEEDMLDRSGGAGPGARLSCQAIAGGGDVVVEVPQDEGRQVLVPSSAAPISLTERAARHFAAQLESYSTTSVRLSVMPAGCAGFGYSVEHTEAIRSDDTVFESRGIRIVVDPASLAHVQGTTVDLLQDGLARRLRFDNPNATETCGCGDSFGT